MLAIVLHIVIIKAQAHTHIKRTNDARILYANVLTEKCDKKWQQNRITTTMTISRGKKLCKKKSKERKALNELPRKSVKTRKPHSNRRLQADKFGVLCMNMCAMNLISDSNCSILTLPNLIILMCKSLDLFLSVGAFFLVTVALRHCSWVFFCLCYPSWPYDAVDLSHWQTIFIRTTYLV